MPKLASSTTNREEDEADIGSIDCRACLTTGNEVSLLIKTYISTSTKYTDCYMWVNNDGHVVIKPTIADPENSQALFVWINLKTIQDGFAFLLQSGYIQGQVVGVENIKDGEPLTLQLPGSDNKQHYHMYKHGSGDYFSLSLKSPDGHFYYILPMNGALKIYREDTIKNCFQDRDFYVFRIGSYKCSNPDGPCPFERMMQKRQM